MEDNVWNSTRNPPARPRRFEFVIPGGSPRTNRNYPQTPPRHQGGQGQVQITRHPHNHSLHPHHHYLDDIALNAMLSGRVFENIPSNYQYVRPIRQGSGFLAQMENFENCCELAWLPRTLPNPEAKKAVNNKNNEEDEQHQQRLIENRNDSRFLIPRLTMEEERDERREKIAEERKETILQWFDRAVEKELKKRQELPTVGEQFKFPETKPVDLQMTKSAMERMAEASASRIEIEQDLLMEPNTELTEAVDKYAKAEAMCKFASAVKAAEAAAEAAPPGFAEEAAVASARTFQTEIHEIHEELEGVKPMEVLGYIGVTKPKNPLKSK